MELNTDILRFMIKEEIQRSLLLEMRPEEEEAAGTIVGILSRLAAEDMDTDSVMNAAQQQFKAASAATGAGNRRDINEMGYDKMQSIDMGVKHHDDHEGNMAKRQMFKTAQYAAEIFDNIQDGDEFPAWIQSKMTKVADYIGAVKHYLEYDHVMGEKLDKDATAGDYVKDFRDSDAPQFKGKSKKKKQEMAVAAYLDAKDNK
jgi:hypothetical protein|tara:strand:- start:1 stop:606 length:606 start_codon:yes stop_codon:yes gene_type:complete